MKKRRLTCVQGMLFEQKNPAPDKLMQKAAKFIEKNGATPIALTYDNSLEGGYHEWVILTFEL
jgi:hypothetical protein